MSPSGNSTFNVEDVLAQLDIGEKIALLSGADFWHTASIPRLNVPAIRLSDGPNGVRGTRFFNGVPAACFPCGTALAATWDTDLIRQGGAKQADECIAKGASILLGPTTNMQRSPLGGRGFESYSEDPYLAGAMTAATVSGIQSKGVAATVKHFVCNDQEHERMGVDSLITERALREIYLMPFQIAQRDAKPWCYMTAYNKINGVHVSENPKILKQILREEWGFDGMVMSDWFGTYTTTDAIKAGLDLEMPGASYVRGTLVAQALACHKLSDYDVDLCVREVLKVVKKVHDNLHIPEYAPETTVDTKETAQLLRSVGASSIVLMKNEGNILPLKKDKTTAVIGPNAKVAAYCGGGSASLLPYYAITPFDGIAAQAKDVKYALGATAYEKLPCLSSMTKTKAGKDGMIMRAYLEGPEKKDRKPFDEVPITKSDIMLMDYKHAKVPEDCLFYTECEGVFTPEESSVYEFSISVAGTAKLWVDGHLVVDNETKQVAGDSFFGSGTREEIGEYKCEKGKSYNILVKSGTLPTQKVRTPGATAMGPGGLRMGGTRKTDAQTEIKRAVELAKTVDQVVICAGLNSDWESEGYDRPHMDLPPSSDDLIEQVCKVNPNTVVVIQSGTPVTMPWVKNSKALLQAWYGGNETGNAIADVVFGNVNPSAKLPLSFPVRNEDNPAFLNYRSERGRVVYGEDVYVGYRFYEKTKKEVAFAFGHGLSYTTFGYKNLSVTDKGDEILVSVEVSNKGKVDGAEVVQVYVAQRGPSIARPVKELKGFKKVGLKAGLSEKVEIGLSKKYAASFYDEARMAWVMEEDTFDVLVGGGSANTPVKGSFDVKDTIWWKGL